MWQIKINVFCAFQGGKDSLGKKYCYYCGWGKKYAVGLGQNGQLARDIHIFLTNEFGERYR